MNNFMNGMKQATNFGYTANGGLQHNHLASAVYELMLSAGLIDSVATKIVFLLSSRLSTKMKSSP